MLTLSSRGPDETRAIGKRLGRWLKSGDLIALEGELGAGKTCLAQGLLEGLGIRGYAGSPTFTILNEYPGRVPVYHFDVYRLGGPDGLDDLGYEEYFYGDGVTIVEWADLVQQVLPSDHLRIRLQEGEETDSRRISIEATGPVSRQRIEEMAE